MEARYVEAGSMNLFRTQNRALKPTSLAGGSQPFSTWVPTPRLGSTMLIRVRGGPVTTIFTAL